MTHQKQLEDASETIRTAATRLRNSFTFEGVSVLMVTQFLLTLGNGIWGPYLNIYFASLDMTGVNIGLLSTIQTAVSSLVMMPAGIMTDRIGRRTPIIVSFALTLVYTVSLAVVRDFTLLMLVTCAQGVSTGISAPATTAYILDKVRERRATALAAFHLTAIFAQMTGTFLGASIAKAYSYQSLFQASAAIICLAGVYTFLRLRESMAPMTESQQNSQSMMKSLGEGLGLMKNTNILLMVVGVVIHHIANCAMPYLGIYFKEVLILDLILIGILMNARSIGDIFGQLPAGMMIDRFGAEVILFFHVLLAAPILYLFTVGNNPIFLFILLLAWGSEGGWEMPSRRLLTVDYAKGMGSATALGAVQSIIGLLGLSAPIVGGLIWDNLGAYPLFQLSAALNAVACIPLLVLVYRNRKPRVA